MSSTLGCLIATCVALGCTFFAIRAIRPIGRTGRDPNADREEEVLPSAPLQRMAWWTLAAGFLLSVAIVGTVVKNGPSAFHGDPTVRVPVTIVTVCGAVLCFLPTIFLRLRVANRHFLLDERDREILGRAPAVQSTAMLVCVAIWSVVLTEVYWDRGQVPIVYLSLIFWSCFLIGCGILLGYGRR